MSVVAHSPSTAFKHKQGRTPVPPGSLFVLWSLTDCRWMTAVCSWRLSSVRMRDLIRYRQESTQTRGQFSVKRLWQVGGNIW